MPPFPRQPDPLVAQNPFRGQSYSHQPILSYLDARPLLPEPVLPDTPEWAEMYWRGWELAWLNLHRPQPRSGFVSNYLGSALNNHTFMWDNAFMMLFGVYGRRAFNFMGTLDNLYAKQHDDGFISREVDSETGSDLYFPFDPNSTGPNILAWAEWCNFRITGDTTRLTAVFPPLMALHRWYRKNRTWQSGLYWATGFSSGMNNQPRVPDSSQHHRHWAWVDASFQASLNCYILRQMAVALEQLKLVPELADERATLTQQINQTMWNEADQFYQDVDKNGRFSRVKSIGAYWGLLDPDVMPNGRREAFIQHLRDPWAFNLPHRIPSQAADSEGYNALTGNQWRGGVWPSTNYMVLKGLHKHGQHLLAHEIALNHLENVWQVYQRTDTLWDNYAPESANPGEDAHPDFVGWTGLSAIAMLLEDVIGLSTDWPLRQVRWNRYLATAQPYGVRNYPLGSDGVADFIGNANKITIQTNASFTLTIVDGSQTIKAPIPIGTTEIDLT